jgi:hypothetical protein
LWQVLHKSRYCDFTLQQAQRETILLDIKAP